MVQGDEHKWRQWIFCETWIRNDVRKLRHLFIIQIRFQNMSVIFFFYFAKLPILYHCDGLLDRPLVAFPCTFKLITNVEIFVKTEMFEQLFQVVAFLRILMKFDNVFEFFTGRKRQY